MSSSDGEDTEEITIPSPSEQARLVAEQKDAEPALKEGATWYLVSRRWLEQWLQYVEKGGDAPGPVDNSDLVDEEGLLRREVQEDVDFEFVSSELWQLLSGWHGCSDEPLARKVITSGYGYTKAIELHLLRLTFLRSSCEETYKAHFSKSEKLRNVLNTMCERMGIRPSDVQMWDYFNDKKYQRMTDMDATLGEERIHDQQKILFEEKVDGRWPRAVEVKRSARRVVEPGLCGLRNMGNTCYMNSGLQCLSNTYPLARFMVSGEYEKQINEDNVLGSQGELVTEFATLMQDIWSGCVQPAIPRDFKWRLERVAPQFAGWQQHDSQELLAMLLDGLHEDLNRVRKKPYFESNEFDDLPPEEAARKTWEQTQARDDSLVRDLFMGQMRSTLDCPQCPRISTTYDPLMYLSVPLPQPTTRSLPLWVWPAGCTGPPVVHRLEVPLDTSALIKDLKRQLHEELGLPADPDAVQLCDVYAHKVFNRLSAADRLRSITERDKIHVYQVSAVQGADEGSDLSDDLEDDDLEDGAADKVEDDAPGAMADASEVDVFLLFKGKSSYSSGTSSYYGGTPSYATSFSLKGNPVCIKMPASTTYGEALALVRQRVAWVLDEEALAAEEQEEDADQPALFLRSCDKSGSSASNEAYGQDDPLLLKRFSYLVLCSNGKGVAFDRLLDDREASSQDGTPPPSALSLDTCMQLYSSREQLGPDDMWYCNKCKEHVQAHKQVELWKLPPILVVHLKRFSYKSRFSREKLDTLVDFPIEGLEMEPYVKGPIPDGEQTVYDLYAVSNHYGALGGGHYTACAKNHNDGKWYRFDDSHVSPMENPREAINSAAYVLFYAKRGFVAEGEKMPLPPGVSEPGQEEDDEEEDEEEEEAPVADGAQVD